MSLRAREVKEMGGFVIFWSLVLWGLLSIPRDWGDLSGSLLAANLPQEIPVSPGRASLWDGLTQGGGEWAGVVSRNSAAFEGGNIGAITKVGPYEYVVQLRSDNDDALPEFWRRWWSMVIEVPTDRPVTITIKGAGQWAYYLPLISYEGEERELRDDAWSHLPERAVDQPDPLTLRIRHQFKKSPVAIARFVPYGLTRMLGFLKQISRHQDVTLHVAGFSPEGRPMPVIKIGKPGTTPQKKVFIHSRTHPGEIGSSFLLEGLIRKILSTDPRMVRLRENVGIEMMPILNVDGVYRGNNRVTPGGINLEGKWYPQNPPNKTTLGSLDPSKTPREVMVWHRWILASLSAGGSPVMALNLHSSSVDPKVGLFSFPHFGPEDAGYTQKEATLFKNQIMFINSSQRAMDHKKWFSPPPKEGGRLFARKNLPETWWWTHFEDRVMALTIEATYGQVPTRDRWVRPDDLRSLGAALAQGIAQTVESLPKTPSDRKPILRTESSLSH